MTIEELQQLWQKKHHGKVADSEHDLQVSCVNWFRDTYPKYAYHLFAIPNGGYRSAKTAADMKAEGQLAGVPDLFLALPRGEFHGLWIEMKNGNAGRLSEYQKGMLTRLRNENYRCAVCHSAIDFRSVIQDYMSLNK